MFKGNYTAYKKLKADKIAREEKEYEAYLEETKKLQAFIDKNRVRATSARAAQDRVKKLEALEVKEKPFVPPAPPAFSFTYDVPSYENVLDGENFTVEAGGNVLLKDACFSLKRGDKFAIVGENGTGKELVARWLHAKSVRAAAPFVEVNCAAIPSELIESELFGHERGAFTSAVKQRKGKFEQADGGTLFMDEIGDMSLAAQAKVLRALQESRISRVGSDRDIEVNVRVVAATNKNLREEIQKGNFREDLYHRLAVIVVRVPPLREHAGDIPALVEHFTRTIASEYGSAPKPIDADALAELQRMPWSGNIRELRNVIERLIILSGDRITARDVKEYC